MEREDRETLRHISETLDAILAVLSKPQSRVERILIMVGTGVTVFGIIHIVDTIKNWIGG